MLVSFIIFCCSFLGVLFFLIWKAPVLAEVTESRAPAKDFVLVVREKIEEGVKRESKERFESFLKNILSVIRKSLLKIEQTTTKWLYTLKRKKKKKDNNKPE